MRLRRGLLLFLAATTMPLLVFALLAVFFVSRNETDSFINAGVGRSRATIAAVDAELMGSVGVLRALARIKSLEDEDFHAFHRDAQAFMATQPNWQNVVLQDPSGRQLANARLPWGTPLPDQVVDMASFKPVASHGKLAIDNVSFAPLLNREPGIALRVPVERAGLTRFVLTAVLRPDAFQTLLQAQQLRSGWVTALAGSDGRFVARIPALPPGTLASASLRGALGKGGDGWFHGQTLEGTEVYTAYATSKLTGWMSGYAIPATVVNRNARDAAVSLGVGLLLALFAVAAGAFLAMRVITRPMAQLKAAANALEDGRALPAVETSIDEIAQVSLALRAAAAAVAERDVALRHSEQQLHAKASALEVANMNKARFLALLSHELRGPLAPVRYGLALLTRTEMAATGRSAVELMERQLANLVRLISDLDDVALIDRGRLDLRMAPFDLAAAVTDAADAVRPRFENKQQRFVVDSTAEPLPVHGDRGRLSQVVLNLLTNACRYTPADGWVTLSARRADGHAEVSVQDGGIGFAPEDAERMFEMFVSLRPDGHGAERGLGIGLALARWLVTAHGGTLTAASPGPGRGATFTLRLPLAADTA